MNTQSPSREQVVRVASVQMESKPGDKEANFGTMETFVRQAASKGVQLILFPECSITGYWFIRNLTADQLEQLAESLFDGPSSQRLRELSESYNITIGAGLIEATVDGHFYNSFVVALPDRTMHRHRKIQAFEHPLIEGGNQYTVFDTPYGFKVGLLICYDNNILENVRMTALMGADIILAPHQTGGCRTRNPNLMGVIDAQVWENRHVDPKAIEREFLGEKGRGWLMRWLPSRAHDNGVFMIFANGVGVDDDEIRTGNAMILDPYGRILTETWKADNDMVVYDLDKALLHKVTGREWMAARRPEMYSLLTQRTGLEKDTHILKFEE